MIGPAEPMRGRDDSLQHDGKLDAGLGNPLEHLGEGILLRLRFGELAAQLGILPFEVGFPVVALFSSPRLYHATGYRALILRRRTPMFRAT
jgi:hypothetical protein